MEISFIHMLMNQNLRVNKSNFHMKSFALGLALKQRRKATQKSPISFNPTLVTLITITTYHFGGNTVPPAITGSVREMGAPSSVQANPCYTYATNFHC